MVIINRSQGLRRAIAEHGRLLAELGGNITVHQQENLVRGRLVLNTIRGADKGTLSAKTLGSERRVSMWRSDIQSGLVIIKAPPLPSAKSKDQLLGEDTTNHDEPDSK
jgi:hypothetical protein